MNERPPNQLVRAFTALRGRWTIVVICLAATVAAAAVITFSETPQYDAEASLLFRDPLLDQKLFGSSFVGQSGDPSRNAATNQRLVGLSVISQRTAARLGMSVAEVTNAVSIAPDVGSDVVNIVARSANRFRAATIANTFAREYIGFRRDADRAILLSAQALIRKQIQSQSLDDQKTRDDLVSRLNQIGVLASLQTGNAELVQPATPPSSPAVPSVFRNLAIAFVVGLLLGVALAMLLERIDRRVRTVSDVEESTGLPVLGSISLSRISSGHASALPAGAQVEEFQLLRSRLRYFNVDRQMQVIAVTSARPDEGKTTVAGGLAYAMALASKKVLLLEVDFRRPTLGSRLGMHHSAGLSGLLTDDVGQDSQEVDYSQRVYSIDAGESTLDVLVAGHTPPNPGKILESERMMQLLSRLRMDYDYVVIDTPPTCIVSDAFPIMAKADGVLLVARSGFTTTDSLATLLSQLESLKAGVLGAVINGTKLTDSYGYYNPVIDTPVSTKVQ